MKNIIPLIIFCALITGCTFNPEKVGNLKFTHTTNSSGEIINYEWNVPPDEIIPILKHLEPRDPKYRGVFIVGYQPASSF